MSAGTTTTDPVGGQAGQVVGQESSLSNWAGPYVTDMLGRGQALANQPYQSYSGPLTAGPTDLQGQAFSGLASLVAPDGAGAGTAGAGTVADKAANMSYDPTVFSANTFDSDTAQQYMNPFLDGALDPQLEELRRQHQISRQNTNSRLTKAGAYGGGRQAVMEAEALDNLARLQNEVVGTGYRDAYDRAYTSYAGDENRRLQAEGMGESSRQFGAGLGLDALGRELQARQAQSSLARNEQNMGLERLQAQLAGGREQRGIEQQGVAADYAQFKDERDYPYRNVQYMQSLLQGLPLAAQSYTRTEPGFLSTFMQGAGGSQELMDLMGFGDLFGGNGGDE